MVAKSENVTSVVLTPTWKAAARMCIMCLEHGSDEGKKVARDELMRMGELCDQLIAERKLRGTENDS